MTGRMAIGGESNDSLESLLVLLRDANEIHIKTSSAL